ncbi:MAG: ATP synthase subunit I [Rhodocyclaceae bacterium]|nr:ATP synthase subunit I [Rhodocyclaceae bacterium]
MYDLAPDQGLPHEIRWILRTQIQLVALLGAVAWFVVDNLAAVSVLMGGGCAIVANGAAAWRAMCRTTSPKKAWQAQVRGESVKMVVTLLMLAGVFRAMPEVKAGALFVGYISTFIIYWLVLLKRT